LVHRGDNRFCRSASGQRLRCDQCFKRRFESICADSDRTRLSASPGASNQARDDAACHRRRSHHGVRASRVDPQVGRCRSYRARSGHAVRPSLALARCRSFWGSSQGAKTVSSLPTQCLAEFVLLTDATFLTWDGSAALSCGQDRDVVGLHGSACRLCDFIHGCTGENRPRKKCSRAASTIARSFSTIIAALDIRFALGVTRILPPLF
jgi:hypothetical protein